VAYQAKGSSRGMPPNKTNKQTNKRMSQSARVESGERRVESGERGDRSCEWSDSRRLRIRSVGGTELPTWLASSQFNGR